MTWQGQSREIEMGEVPHSLDNCLTLNESVHWDEGNSRFEEDLPYIYLCKYSNQNAEHVSIFFFFFY